MAAACPVSFKQVDATIVRIGAFYIIAAVSAFLITSNVLLLYILGADTLIRIYGPVQYSIIHQLGSVTKSLLRLSTKKADAGAKRLAGQFAVLFILMLIVGYHFDLSIFVMVTAGVFLSCASLEMLFDYCVGCKVYYILKYFFPGFHS